ncbi:MAG: spermidine synthase [Myxococcota bacterium]|jgi:spermidine synthase
MDKIALAMRRERAVGALLPLFFVSGATALVYQTLWNRQLHLVFGTSTFAIATVLSAFMLGLALGGFALGRVADRLKRPLAIYGLLEVGIGLYALVFPPLLTAVGPIYLEIWRSFEPGPVAFGLVQFALLGVLLIVPTAMMGGTLPLLARFATERLGAAGDRVGTLYAVNTFGAVFGTWFAGFVLLPAYGLWLTTILASVANLALGAAAIALDVWARAAEQSEVEPEPVEGVEMHPLLVPVSVAMFLIGFASLVYEVAWTRLMALMIGASVYAFSVMLLAFLTGIAIGGKIGGPLADQLLERHGQAGVLRALALVEVGVAVLSYLLMYVFPELPFWYVWLFDWMGAGEAPRLMWVVSLLLSGAVMTPPAILMGIAFPIAVRAVVGVDGKLGGPVGTVYGANTLGGVFGAFLAGFVLLPMLYVQGTIFIAAAANLLAAAVCLVWSARRSGERWMLASPVLLVVLGLGFVAQRPPWDPMLMTAGMYHYVSHFEDHSREGIQKYAVGKYTLVFYEEGLSSVVTVAENIDSGNMWLANNGKVDASTTTDMPTQVLCSLLPMQFADDPSDVLVIGLASGITAGAVTLHPAVKRLDVVELEPAIERAAEYFGEYNHDVLRDPRVNLIANDGRNHLLLTAEQTYDVIVSEPSNPWISGVSNLFTREFWEMGKKRLKPGGVWGQWVQMYGMDDSDLRSLLATFAAVYPHVIVYATIEDADLVLVGSESELLPGPDAARSLLKHPDVAAELKVVDINDPMDVVSLFQMDRATILEMVGNSPLNTDDNMLIEYSAPLHLHVDTSHDNFRMLIKHAGIPFFALPDDPLVYADLARTYPASDDPIRSVQTMAAAVKMLPLDSALREELLSEAERWQAELVAEPVDDEVPDEGEELSPDDLEPDDTDPVPAGEDEDEG